MEVRPDAGTGLILSASKRAKIDPVRCTYIEKSEIFEVGCRPVVRVVGTVNGERVVYLV